MTAPVGTTHGANLTLIIYTYTHTHIRTHTDGFACANVHGRIIIIHVAGLEAGTYTRYIPVVVEPHDRARQQWQELNEDYCG